MEPLAPGMRRLGKLLRVLPGASITRMNAAQIEQAQSRPTNAITRFLCGSLHAGVAAEDRRIPGPDTDIPIRIYRPKRDARAARPLVLAIHGGGFVLGNLDMADWMASTVAHDLDAVVVSVGYRLAPRHPFPAAVEDCFAVLEWSAGHAASLGVATGRLGVMGESAGGNLAAVLAIAARERGGPAIHHQGLIYPVVDLAGDTASRRTNADALFLTDGDMRAYSRHYLGGWRDVRDWRLSPLHAGSHGDLPPAFIIVAGHDPLRDDGYLYAEALTRASVAATVREYPAMPHGFINFPRFNRDARPALQALIQAQRRVLCV